MISCFTGTNLIAEYHFMGCISPPSLLCSILAKNIFAYIFYESQQQNKYNEEKFESISTSIAVSFMFCQASKGGVSFFPSVFPSCSFCSLDILVCMWGAESSTADARTGRRELLQGFRIKWGCCNTLQLEKGEICNTQQQTMSMTKIISFKKIVDCLAALMCYI